MFGTFQLNDFKLMDKLVNYAIRGGIRAFDTAPSYGTEKLLGQVLKNLVNFNRKDFFIQDKIDAIQMYQFNSSQIELFVLGQLKMLQIDYLDALLIHWPFIKYFNRTWESLLDLKEKGLVLNIGVCNIDRRGFEILFKEYDSPDIIQNEITPLNVTEDNVQFFQNLHCTVQAYSPLGRMNNYIITSEILNNISKKYGVSIAQIILKWHIQKGIIPIFTSKKIERIKENLSLDFTLTQNEIKDINSMNKNYKIFPISYGCPGY